MGSAKAAEAAAAEVVGDAGARGASPCICCPACMGCCVPASQGGVRAGVANPRDGLVPKPPKPKSDADLLRASPSGLWGAAGDGTA